MTLRTGNLPRLWLLSHRTSRARLVELLDGARAALADEREVSALANEELARCYDTIVALRSDVRLRDEAMESERQWRLRSLPELLAAKALVDTLKADLVATTNRAENAEATSARLRGYVEIVRAGKAPAAEEGRP